MFRVGRVQRREDALHIVQRYARLDAVEGFQADRAGPGSRPAGPRRAAKRRPSSKAEGVHGRDRTSEGQASRHLHRIFIEMKIRWLLRRYLQEDAQQPRHDCAGPPARQKGVHGRDDVKGQPLPAQVVCEVRNGPAFQRQGGEGGIEGRGGKGKSGSRPRGALHELCKGFRFLLPLVPGM